MNSHRNPEELNLAEEKSYYHFFKFPGQAEPILLRFSKSTITIAEAIDALKQNNSSLQDYNLRFITEEKELTNGEGNKVNWPPAPIHYVIAKRPRLSVQIIESVEPSQFSSSLVRDKNSFLKALAPDLNTMSKAQILDLFTELKDPNGKYSFIHEQKNPLWDSFRLFFKSSRNNENDFWHTATYQTAVKMLKNAYLNKRDNTTFNRQDEEDNLIDYVRGNSPISIGKTSTRRNNI